MPSQALVRVVYPRSQSLPLAVLNRPRLLAPVEPLRELATALDVFLTRATGALLGASLEEAREATAAKAFLGLLVLLVLLVRRGLIEGVYGSDVGDESPSEAADGKDGGRSTRLGLNHWTLIWRK
jgi:hypothetical protein